MFDPSFKPSIKVDSQTIFATSTDPKNCIWPVAKDELYAGEKGGKIVRIKLIGDNGCSYSVLSDNNHGKPITDILVDNTNQVYFIDSERLQLKRSEALHKASVVLQAVCSESNQRGKIMRLFLRKNLIFVKSNESNTVVVLNQAAGRIEEEIEFPQLKGSKKIADFDVDPQRGDIVAISNTGDVLIRGGEDSHRDAFYEFKGREKERFRAVAVDWEHGLLITVGTQTQGKYLHQHVLYVYDITDPARLSLRCKTKLWETNEPEFRDSVAFCYLQKIQDSWYISCFTDFTSAIVVFKFDDYFNSVEIVSFPQRLNKSKLTDVRQAFGYYYASFESQDLSKIKIHSPSSL